MLMLLSNSNKGILNYQGVNLFHDYTSDIDYINNTKASNSLTTSRASSGSALNTNNELLEFSSNVPRITNKGLLLEESRANIIRNSSTNGAVLGIIGSGGALPTNWSVGGASGVTVEVVAIGVKDGFEYVDIKFSGPNSLTFGTVVFDSALSTFVTGTAYASQMRISLVAGSLTNMPSHSLRTRYYLSPSGATDIFTVFTPTSSNLKDQRISSQGTTSGTITGGGMMFYQWNQNPGDSVNVTLRFSSPQIEVGSYLTSYIKTTGSSVTRSGDLVYLSSFSQPKPFTVFAEFQCPLLGSNKYPGVFAVSLASDYSNNRCGAFIGDAGSDQAGANFKNAGATVVNTVAGAALTAGQIYKTALTFENNNVKMYVNGSQLINNTSVSLPTFDQFRLGMSDNTLNSFIRKLAVFNRALTSAELTSLSLGY